LRRSRDREQKRRARAAGTVLLATVTAVLCQTGLTVQSAAAAPRQAGVVLAWGNDSNGQVGHGNTITGGPAPVVEVILPARTRVTAVAGGSVHSLALTSDGRVLAWGSNYLGQLGVGSDMGDNSTSTPVLVHLPAGTDVTAIAAGFRTAWR
jgi:alpha-tubulin suppressor-like RCC1 family protein